MRPTTSYLNQGADSYRDGLEEGANPHPAGTPKALQWTIGWLKALRRDPLAFDDHLDELADLTDERIRGLETEHREWMHRIASALPPARVCARRIAVPLKNWPGNCYLIATAVLKAGLVDDLKPEHGAARVAYGLYTGPIAKTGRFGGRPISHHGWIEFDSGLVVDPTAWAFTDTAPALAATSIDEYDLAGSRFRSMVVMRPAPPFGKHDKTFVLPVDEVEGIATAGMLLGAGPEWDRRLGLAQMMWLANLPLEQLGSHAKPLYRAIASTGNAAMIPIDNRLYVDEAIPDELPAVSF